MKRPTLVVATVAWLLVLVGCDRSKPVAEIPYPFIQPVNGIEEFNTRILQADGLVVVDFYADWCGPCRDLKPILNRTAEKMQGKVSFFAVNIDRHEDLAEQYNVSPIPDVRFFFNGSQVGNAIGSREQNFWEAEIDRLLQRLSPSEE